MEKNKIKNEKETQEQEWVEYVFSVAVPMPLFVAEETKQRIGQEIKKLLEEFIAEPRVIEFKSS